VDRVPHRLCVHSSPDGESNRSQLGERSITDRNCGGLIRTYRRTREVAVVWLGVAVVVWPAISALLQAGERSVIDRMVHKQPGILFLHGQLTPGTLIASLSWVNIIIERAFWVVAVVYLSKAIHNKSPQVTV
jgi:hypothetical protein